MAIYIYSNSDGSLYSYIPDNVTIAQAQATCKNTNGLSGLADNTTLSKNNLTAIDNQPQLSSTVVWDPVSKGIKVIIPAIPPTPPIATGAINISGNNYTVTLS